MKKRTKIAITAVLILLIIPFIPIPRGTLDDGGSRVFDALTYKLVFWKRISNSGTDKTVKLYFYPDNKLSIDDLWQKECEKIYQGFKAEVLEINGDSVLVRPAESNGGTYLPDKISFGKTHLQKIDINVGDTVYVKYKGGIAESYPAQIFATSWELINDKK